MKLAISVFILLYSGAVFSQQASDYFPQQPGYKWKYELTILDTLNNPVPGFNFFRMDSSALIADYEGKNAYHILTKAGTEKTIPFLPYTDTNFVHLSGTDAYEYYRNSELQLVLSLLDSTTLNSLLPFIGLLEIFNGWYLNYRFANNVNQQYLVASIDTSVFYMSTEIPLRFILNGKRLEDENVNTGLGTFLCKKFLLTRSVNYLIAFPPLPPVAVPIVTTFDTVWIAPGNWIVKEIIPSTNLDLTLAGLENYLIPGLKREIVSEPTVIISEAEELVTFNLRQNFPNPFNPSTKINFSIARSGFVSVKVYDLLGKEISVLMNDILDAGDHEIIFDGSSLSTGVYFYTLAFSDNDSKLNHVATKQMVLIK